MIFQSFAVPCSVLHFEKSSKFGKKDKESCLKHGTSKTQYPIYCHCIMHKTYANTTPKLLYKQVHITTKTPLILLKMKKKLIQRQRKVAIFQKIVISQKNCTCCKTVLCDCIVFGQNCKFQDGYQKEIPRIDSISHLDKELQHYIIEQDKKLPCDFFYDQQP